MHKKRIIFFLFILLVISLTANIFLFMKINGKIVAGNYLPLISSNKEIINSEDVIIYYNGLKSTIMQDIKDYNADGKVGVFLQDIKTGTWLGINEREEFIPASLFKIPILMAILKKIERNEIKLTDKITLIPDDLDNNYGELYKAGSGAEFTIEDLLREMILASDNTAKNALIRQVSPAEINAVFTNVGIPNPYNGVELEVSPRDYSRMFKSLYYSSFLSPELSEKALDFTTDTQEENLISSGVPYNVQVAHKFGIVAEAKMLHDCGIVYHQRNPYFLCIMTKEIDLSDSEKLIPKISKDIYEFVDNK